METILRSCQWPIFVATNNFDGSNYPSISTKEVPILVLVRIRRVPNFWHFFVKTKYTLRVRSSCGVPVRIVAPQIQIPAAWLVPQIPAIPTYLPNLVIINLLDRSYT